MQTDTTATKVKKGRSQAVYAVNKDMGIAERIADYLNWMADHEPGKFVPWNIIAFNVMMLPRVPRNNTESVKMVQRASSRSYRILETKYGRLYYPLKGYGVRACVDDDDMAKNGIRTSVKRGRSAIATIRRQTDLIDERKISNTAEMRPYKEFVTNQLKPSLRNLTSLENKLMLPPLVDE
jgi:hypothetical protein